MAAAFVLGNGISRQAIDLNQLKTLGTTYGCNAIYREFEPDVLISTDAPISERIQHEGYSQTRVHYTRKPFPDSGARRIAQKYFGFSSGPVAVGQAALDGARAIYLVGFDMGPTVNAKFNNVYAGTDFYKKPDAAPTYTGNWVKQLCTIAQDFPQTTFVRVCGTTTADIRELKVFNNLLHIPVQMFQDRVTTGIDL